MNLRDRLTNFSQLKESEKLYSQQKTVNFGLWLMIVANMVFTAAYGWEFAPPAGVPWYARVFSTVIHMLFIDVATIIWMVAIVAADSDRQRWLAEVMHLIGLVLSTIASVVFAYLAFGGELVPVGHMVTIKGIGFYTMLGAAGLQFLSAYGYRRFSPENKLAQDRAAVRRLRKANMVGFQADLAIETENHRGELLAPYRDSLVAQNARQQTEEALLAMGYSPEQVNRLLPEVRNAEPDRPSLPEIAPQSGSLAEVPLTIFRPEPSSNGHHDPKPMEPAEAPNG